jgi:hypothetical protein
MDKVRLKLAIVGAEYLRLNFLRLAERYAGTPWETDPAYLAAKKATEDAEAVIAQWKGEHQ